MPWPIWAPGSDAIGVLAIPGGAAAGAYRVEFVVVDVARRAVRRSYPLPEGAVSLPVYFAGVDKLRWAPDGSAVLLSWGAAMVLDLRSGDIEWISREPVVAEWSPDSRGVYYFAIPNADDPRRRHLGEFFYRARAAASATRLADRAALDAIGLRQARFLVFGLMELSPSGRQLAVAAGSAGGDSSGVRLYGLAPGAAFDVTKPTRTLWTDAVVTSLEWSPDERQLAAVLVRRTGIGVERFDIQTGIATAMTSIDLRNVQGPAIDLLALLRVISWTQ